MIDFTPDKSDPQGVIGTEGDNIYFRARFPWGGFGETVLLGRKDDPKTLEKVRECVAMPFA